MKKGKFIVFEGCDGSGKDKQLEMLKPFLFEDTIFTREPGGNKISEEIRSLLMKHSSEGMSAETELLLFYAARIQLLEGVIWPALDRGINVFSSRFSHSTVAFQIEGNQKPELINLLKQIELHLLKEWKPDFSIIFDVPVSVAAERMKHRGGERTRFDDKPIDFHERVRQGYINSVKILGYNDIIVDGSPSEEEVHTVVLKALEGVVSFKKPLS